MKLINWVKLLNVKKTKKFYLWIYIKIKKKINKYYINILKIT